MWTRKLSAKSLTEKAHHILAGLIASQLILLKLDQLSHDRVWQLKAVVGVLYGWGRDVPDEI